MTVEEQQRLWDLVQNPPPGSKIEAAIRVGINLRLNIQLLGWTPTQRLERHEYLVELQEKLDMSCGSLVDHLP